MEPWEKKRQERLVRERAARNEPNPTVNFLGQAVFPDGITQIRDRALDGNKNMRTAVLPNTVKRIGDRAFADCTNLKSLVLNEGLEKIGSNVFTGCNSLKEIVFPDSVKKIEAFAFYKSSFLTPVLNMSGDILFRCPEVPGRKKYVVPDGVREIQAGAFLYLEELESVILPPRLEYIRCRSFLGTGIRKLIIPATVKNVESKSFWGCKNLEQVIILCGSEALCTGTFHDCPNVKLIAPGQELDAEEIRRILGRSGLTMNYKLEIPKGDFWADEHFAALARQCATGDTEAMMEFADYYARMGSGEFYEAAANYWRIRAHSYGNPQAAQWRKDWLRNKPGTLIPVAMSPYFGSIYGNKLRALGFEFFEPEREYSFSPKDEQGVIEVSSWCGMEGPDEDGFGMEEQYETWFLDEFLNPIPGIPMIGSHSSHYRRNFPEEFEYYRELAAKVLHKE